MGIFSYSEKESNKLIAKALVDFLGGSNVVGRYLNTNENILKFLKKKNFFTITGLGSFDSLSDSSKQELASWFRDGVKLNNFSNFFNFSARFNPKIAIGKDIEKVYVNRYNEFVEKVVAKQRKRKNSDQNAEIKLEPFAVNKKALLDTFDTSIINEGVMGAAIKGSKDVSAIDAVALLASANKVLEFYRENDKSVEHYRSTIQKLLYEDSLVKVEKEANEKPSKKEKTHTTKSKKSNDYEYVSSIFDGIKRKKSAEKDKEKDKKKEETVASEKEPEVTYVKKKKIKKIILDDLKDLKVDTKALQELLTNDDDVKYYLSRKDKAVMSDIKDIVNADERIKSLVLAPVFETYLGVSSSKKVFDPTQISKNQIELFCKLVGTNKENFSTVLERVENYSTILKNIFKESLKGVKNAAKIKNAIIKEVVSSNALAKENNLSFLEKILPLVFEPSVKTLIEKNIKLPEGQATESSPKKRLINGYIRVNGEVLIVEGIPVSLVNKDGEMKYDFKNATFSKVELEKFKNDISTQYGCDMSGFDPKTDVIIGLSPFLNDINGISNSVNAEKMSKISNSPVTREFIKSKKYYDGKDMDEVYKQVDVKNRDYSIYKNMAFYKNAKERAYNKAQKAVSEMKEAEEAQKNQEQAQKNQERPNSENQGRPNSQNQEQTQRNQARPNSQDQEQADSEEEETQEEQTERPNSQNQEQANSQNQARPNAQNQEQTQRNQEQTQRQNSQNRERPNSQNQGRPNSQNNETQDGYSQGTATKKHFSFAGDMANPSFSEHTKSNNHVHNTPNFEEVDDFARDNTFSSVFDKKDDEKKPSGSSANGSASNGKNPKNKNVPDYNFTNGNTSSSVIDKENFEEDEEGVYENKNNLKFDALKEALRRKVSETTVMNVSAKNIEYNDIKNLKTIESLKEYINYASNFFIAPTDPIKNEINTYCDTELQKVKEEQEKKSSQQSGCFDPEQSSFF